MIMLLVVPIITLLSTFPSGSKGLQCYFCSHDESAPFTDPDKGELVFDDARCLFVQGDLPKSFLRPCDVPDPVCITTQMFKEEKKIVLRDCASKGSNELKCTNFDYFEKHTCYCNDRDGCNDILHNKPPPKKNNFGRKLFGSAYLSFALTILTMYLTL